jgi:DMSO/TMAO reductase YedYZ heme-binding membrane subunit
MSTSRTRKLSHGDLSLRVLRSAPAAPFLATAAAALMIAVAYFLASGDAPRRVLGLARWAALPTFAAIALLVSIAFGRAVFGTASALTTSSFNLGSRWPRNWNRR